MVGILSVVGICVPKSLIMGTHYIGYVPEIAYRVRIAIGRNGYLFCAFNLYNGSHPISKSKVNQITGISSLS